MVTEPQTLASMSLQFYFHANLVLSAAILCFWSAHSCTNVPSNFSPYLAWPAPTGRPGEHCSSRLIELMESWIAGLIEAAKKAIRGD
jgi:hypothetical protein